MGWGGACCSRERGQYVQRDKRRPEVLENQKEGRTRGQCELGDWASRAMREG